MSFVFPSISLFVFLTFSLLVSRFTRVFSGSSEVLFSKITPSFFRKSPRPLFTLKEGSIPIPSPFPSKGKGVHRPLASLRYRQQSLCPKGLPIFFSTQRCCGSSCRLPMFYRGAGLRGSFSTFRFFVFFPYKRRSSTVVR